MAFKRKERRADPFKALNAAELELRLALMDGVENPVTGTGGLDDPVMSARPTLGTERLLLEEIDYLVSYENVVRRAVEDLVNRALSAGWKVNGMNASTWFDAFKTPITHARLVTAVRDAAIKARRTGAGGLILIPSSELIDLSQPLHEQREALLELGEDFSIVNLIAFDRWEISVEEWDMDPRSEHFKKALVYGYDPVVQGTFTSSEATRKIHRDHIVMFPGNPLPTMLAAENEQFDDSVVQGFWNACRAFLETANAISSIVQSFETATLSIAGLAHMELGNNHGLIRERAELVAKTKSVANVILVDADSGESFKRDFATLNGLEQAWDRAAATFVAAVGSTMTRIFGLSPSGLGGDDVAGRALLAEKTSDYQTSALAPALLKLYSLILSAPVSEIELEFHPSETLTALEKAQVRESESRALTGLKTAGIIPPEGIIIELERSGSITTETAALARQVFAAQAEAPLAPTGTETTPVGVVPQGAILNTPKNPSKEPGNPALVHPELAGEWQEPEEGVDYGY